MTILGGFEFSVFELVILGILIVSFIYQVFFYCRYLNIVFQNKKSEKKGNIKYRQEFTPVSVIICAKDETDNLRRFLPEVLTQEYPEYEVIVVNDGGNEDTEALLREYKKVYPHLKSTFVPDGTTNLSTKKLALTLGIKAAQFEWLLFTDADCLPEGKLWIARMARNFVSGVEFVLGYGAYLQEKNFLNRLITYDTLFNGLQYLGFAAHGNPYMGVGRNMAYRKEVFFRNKGFASTLHLRSGDDDLMVNHTAHAYNTRVETSAESITLSKPEKSFKNWYYQKERHLSVSTFYKPGSKISLVIEPFFRGLFYISLLALIVWSSVNYHWILTISALLLFIIRYIVQLIVINRSSTYYGGRRFVLSLIILDIILPLITSYIMSFGRMGGKAKNISWK
jgi:glycosyltransferase involved in cell wall biosynthesis